MRFFTAALACAAPALVAAAPTLMTRSQSEATVAVLKFAAVLEQLETEFYSQALRKFQPQDFTAAGITVVDVAVEAFVGIQTNEASHTDVLVRAIHDNGDMPIEGCRLDFGGALNDVATMIATARVLELVGVNAYIGATPLVAEKSFLVAAASILTIEARHQTILNTFNSATGIPQAFDFGMTPGEVLTIASAFVSGCDIPNELNFDRLGLEGPKPPLQIKNTGAVNPGTQLEFDSPALQHADLSRLSCQMIFGGASEAQSFPAHNCIVPNGINGPVLIFLTTHSQPLQSNVVNRLSREASSVILAGPTIAFIDVQVDSLGALIRNSNNPVESTQTISPSEAQEFLGSATTTAGEAFNTGESFNTGEGSTTTSSAQEAFNTSAPQNAIEAPGSNSDVIVIGVTFISVTE